MFKVLLSLLLPVVLLADQVDLHAQVRVRGYYRKDGTYVRPHYRSRPDGNFSNNWSTKGNINPYTGKVGTKTAPSRSSGSSGDVHVDGYYRKDGTYVRPHYRSRPDGNFSNNWSTKGNVNPYTGAVGTKTAPSTAYSSPRPAASRSPPPATYGRPRTGIYWPGAILALLLVGAVGYGLFAPVQKR